jgi:hypothetical protein
MRALASAVLIAAAATTAHAGDGQGCPMKAKEGRQAQVGHRHERTTSVPTDGTVHHFLLARDGGSIRLEAQDGSPAGARDRIRAHLQVIARSFAAGDFSMPMGIHEQVPPGVEVMKARRESIRYRYEETANGGTVTISTADPEALSAVHDFLRFQIHDHGTGDPTDQG